MSALRCCRLLTWVYFVLAVLALLYASGLLVVFEDGSWGIGSGFPYWLGGCIPLMPCM